MRSRSARDGFAFRYSITSASTPRSPRISSAPRDLLHTGLWYTTTLSSVMTPRLPLVAIVRIRKRRNGRRRDGGCEQLEVPRTRHVDRAERRQVRRRPLHVEQHATAGAHEVDERDHRDLRRVGDAVELRLRREQSADGDAVETPDERVAPAFVDLPRLDAVRPTET